MNISWYHGSPYELTIESILQTGKQPVNFKESNYSYVSLTSEPKYAVHWAKLAAKKLNLQKIFLYEVTVEEYEIHRQGPKNFGKDTAYYEVLTPKATIINITVIEL